MAKATVVEGGVRGNGGHGNNGDKNNNGGKKKSGGGKQRGVGGVVAGDRAAPSSPPPPQTRRRGEGRGGGGGGGRSRFSIDLSGRFLLFSSCLPALLAFVVGWGARFALLSQLVDRPTAGGGGLGDDHDHDHDHDHDQSRLLHLPPPGGGGGMSKKGGGPLLPGDGGADDGSSSSRGAKQLPAPRVIEGKDVPYTTYASKTFQMAGAATSHTLHIDRTGVGGASMMSRSRKEFDGGPDFQDGGGEDVGGGDGDGPCEAHACSRGREGKATTTATATDDHNDDSDGMHLPAGQHLLVDIKDVDSLFLNSEERLAAAMLEAINESRLTLLSYHCHSLVPIGVSCAGVLLESHVAFHTWPAEGVITMDVFTCGGGLLVPMLPSLMRLFGVPNADDDDAPYPTMLWSHKLRGFREGFAKGYVRSTNPLDGSLGRYVLGRLDFDVKRPLLSTRTAYQNVNVYEVSDPRRSRVGSADDEDGSSSSTTTDKILFLDGVIQSTLHGDAPYHESIVHPAMLSHPGPRRVAIIGGGEGATLREVLKHRSVEEVVILEIDEELVGVCREHMPEWSYCGDIDYNDGGDGGGGGGGRSGDDASSSCFDDRRARLIYEDAFEWFVTRFGREDDANDEGEKKFDVIIMDALDPKTSLVIAGGLYDDAGFVDSLFNGLTAEGVFVVQMGKSRMITDPPDDVGRFKNTGLMIKALEVSGFGSIHTYDEGHSHFYMPWSYLVALKDYKSKARWHRTAPELQIALRQRLHRTKSGRPVLRYFDATTMVSYQLPSRAQETTYCRQEAGDDDEIPWDCGSTLGFYEDHMHLPMEYLRVGKSGVGERAGRGLFAARDIPSHASIGVDKGVKGFHSPPLTWSVLNSMFTWSAENENEFRSVEDEISAMFTYVEGYGTGSVLMGEVHLVVESCILLFMNHGCNGTYNFGNEDDGKPFTEMDVESFFTKDSGMNFINKAPPFSPVYERHLVQLCKVGDGTTREIKAGEEILTDYLAFGGEIDEFMEDALQLRSWCTGESVGDITEYEES